jgi:spermidine synthase
MTRIVALFLTILTGFSGLAYEVTWEKYLAALVGSHSEATAAVLGIFLGGLAVGYALFGAVTRRVVIRAEASGRPLRLLIAYGGVETAIGCYASLFPVLFQGARLLSFSIPHGTYGVGFAVDVVLAALLIGPPTVLMGGTIPMLTQALSRSLDDATRTHALVYGFNTGGAFMGALATGFWLIPQLGLVGVMLTMGLVNILAGAVFIAFGLRLPVSAASASAADPGEEAKGVPSSRTEALAAFTTAALLCGFAMMTIQTVLIRLGGLSFGSSQYTFSIVVAVFVLCIALGGFAVSALPRIRPHLLVADLWALVVLLVLLYTQLQDAPYWIHVLRSLFGSDAASFYPYHFAAFGVVLLVIGIPVGLSGALLPLIFHHLRGEIGHLGTVAGRLYSWNTVGSFLGALLGGYALLYWLDLHHVFRLALAALALAAVVVTVRVSIVGRPGGAALLVAALTAIALLPAWSPYRLSSGLFRKPVALSKTYEGPDAFFASVVAGTLPFYDDDPTASIAVKERLAGDGSPIRSITTNGKSDGSVVYDYLTTALLGLLPSLFAERAETAFVIGFGTGVTAGELSELRSMREVVVAEISPAVVRAAPLFDYGNRNASKRTNIRVFRGDAIRTLERSERQFDVIVSEPSNPWVAGMDMFYSREFLETARDHIAPGGVHAQWLHRYETDDETIEMVLKTYVSVFDHVAVWYGKAFDLILIGVTNPETAVDLDRLAERVARADFSAGLERCGIYNLQRLLAHELLPMGVINATTLSGRIHSLFHPRLSHIAARGFFKSGEGNLPVTALLATARVGARNSLVRRLADRNGGQLSEEDRVKLTTEENPHSWRREDLLAQIREQPAVAESANLDLVEPLSRLYRDAEVAMWNGNTVDAAIEASETFARYYDHGVPFSRAALANIWRRCEADPHRRDDCIAARAQAETSLGDLAEPLDPD